MRKLILACVLGLTWMACNKEEGVIPVENYENYNQVIDAGGPVEEPPAPSTEVVDEDLADQEQDGELWRCTSQRLPSALAKSASA